MCVCVCVALFVSQGYRDQLAELHIPSPLIRAPTITTCFSLCPQSSPFNNVGCRGGPGESTERDHKIESVWKVADLKWSSRWTSFVFESTGTQPLNPHFPTIATIATVVTVAHNIETTRLKGSEKRQIWNGERIGTPHHCSDLPLFSVAPPFNPQLPSFPRLTKSFGLEPWDSREMDYGAEQMEVKVGKAVVNQ